MTLTNKYVYRAPILSLQGCKIPARSAIDTWVSFRFVRLSFVIHVSSAAAGAKKDAAVLKRLMPNVGGPSQAKRRLLMSVVHSRLLYDAVVWCELVLKIHKCKNLFLQAQRYVVLWVAKCYCTTWTWLPWC